MDLEYVDILTGENCRQFSLIIWTPFIGQFVHPVGMKGMGKVVILASCEYYFIRVHENLVQHPSRNKSIIKINLLT